MLFATEQIRRMRGGAQSHLMRCSDGHYYVVKFQNNPQHRRILVNELLGTRLAGRLGLPITPGAIVHVSEELIRLTPELSMEMPRSRVPCQAGLQFGSRYPGDPRRLTLHDFLPDEQVRAVENLHHLRACSCLTNGPAIRMGGRPSFFARKHDGRYRRAMPTKTRASGPTIKTTG